MSFASKPKNIRPKGVVQQIKLVDSVTRRGKDIIKTEEVKTPTKNKTTAKKHLSSPSKRAKLEAFDAEPIPFCLDEGESSTSRTRQTLVSFLYLHL